jgi:hypothetical protein
MFQAVVLRSGQDILEGFAIGFTLTGLAIDHYMFEMIFSLMHEQAGH